MKSKLVVMLSIALFATSCSDYLDKLPENKVEKGEIDFTKVEDMHLPVSGVYAQARSGQGFSFWGALGLISVRSDNVDKGSAPNDQLEFQHCANFKYDNIRSYWALNNTWKGFYKLVEVSNSALASLDQYAEYITKESDQKLYEQYTAEVRFMRAYAFFFATRLWGDIPLMLDNQVLNPEREPRADVYKFIDDEMEYCISKLPALRPNEMDFIGSVTQYTAWALRAKAAADVNDWDTVLKATNAIISSTKFELYDDFYEMYKKPGKLCNESLFELQYTDFGQGVGDIIRSDAWFAFQGPRTAIKGYNGIPINSGWGFMVPTQALNDLMVARGEYVRYKTTIMKTDAVTPSKDTLVAGLPGEPTMYNGKAYLPASQLTPGRQDYGDGNNIRMIRYADILLLNAEAKVRKGESGDSSFNLVRERAGMTPVTGVTLEQILEERRVELAMEWGERFFDLVRTGKAAEKLQGFVEGQHEFYPIPQEQLDLNPNLK
jgi:hypothetical protein